MADAFDDLLYLEDRFYEEGYHQGVVDGKPAGQSEGRTLGLETAFQKFVEAGRLEGRAVVWANRLPVTTSESTAAVPLVATAPLRPLPANARLRKNIALLYALVEPGTLPTANTDMAVNDVDDRVKRARGKARIVQKIVDEGRD